jgi:prevent-host-death family protein
MHTSSSVSVPLAEAKNRLSELIDRVSRGEEFVITRHNAEIARLVPVRRPTRRDVGDAIAKMRATRGRRRATVNEILQWRNEGRR